MNEGIKYTAAIVLIAGMLAGAYIIPNTITPSEIIEPTTVREATWNIENDVVLGSLDESYSSGNSSILAVWVVNHSSTAEDTFKVNDSTTDQVNATNTVHGYAQGSSFDIEIPHSTSCDLLIYVRANKTNAATGTTAIDQFNDAWVMLNITTGTGLGCTGGVNLSGVVCQNSSGDDFIYMMFVYNGTDTGIVDIQGWNDAMCGTGFTIPRDNRSYITSMKLLCYY